MKKKISQWPRCNDQSDGGTWFHAADENEVRGVGEMGDRRGILEIAQESSEAAAKLRQAEKAHREPSGETYRAKKAEIQDIKRPAHGTQSSARDNIIEAQKMASNAKLEISELA